MRLSKDTLILTLDQIETLCEKEESHFFDKKSSRIKPKALLKHVVAFANADGGELIIGIKDDKEEENPLDRWEGLPSIELFNGVFQCLSELESSVDYFATFLKSTGHQTYALRILVEKSHIVHSTIDGGVYVRSSAQSLKINSQKRIQELSYEKGEKSFEDKTLQDVAPEEITQSLELGKFLNYYSPNSDPIDFISKVNLINKKSFEPRVSGILLFSDNPSYLMPTKCSIKIVRYTTDRIEPLREHLNDNICVVEGPLYQIIQSSMDKIGEMTNTIKKWDANGNLKDINYPFEAVWEILVNAVIHRDYSISDDVQIIIFDDRIEIISPGKLPGRVNINNILKMSFARNPKIVKFLNRYENPPNKDIGEGLRTAFQKMKEFHLKDPQITQDSNYVKVTLFHERIASPSEMILNYLQESPSITNRKLRELTGIRSEAKALGILRKLAKNGFIKRVDGKNGKAAAWALKNEIPNSNA